MSSSTPTSAPEPPPLRFDGLHIRDKHGSNVASVRAEVTRRGVTLVGKKGTLGSFPFQSIGSWAHASDTTLSLIVTANGAQREVVVAGDPATVTAVLAAIDATVNDIIEEMTKPGGSAEKIARDEPADARYATPAPSDDGSASGTPDDHDAGVDWRALAEKAAATSPTSPIAPGEESLRAEDRRRASLAEADAAAARAEARRAAVAEAAAEARVAAAERRAEVAEARAEAAERRARDYAAAASLDVTPNPESEPGDESALPAAARLAETTSRLESSESLIKALREELERARAEADAARASARQLASSAATNAAAAAAHYQTQSGRVAESPVAESSEDATVAAATAVAMRSHAEAEDLRLLLESAETDARRHAERADAAVSDAETAWARAAEAHEGTRALADELKRAKRAAENARVEGERALRRAERAASAARERDASKLEAANAVARRLGQEKGDLEGETARLRAELEAAHRARDTSQRHLDAAAAASLRRRDEAASLAKRLEDAETDARRHAERADAAETELEDVRKSAEDVSRKLDAHARDGEAEAAASVSERRRLAEALRCASAERDVAENKVADAEARAAAAEGERDGLAARVATLVTRMEETRREANARVAAAEERARVAVAEADEAKRAELGTRAELDAARAARDALAADVRASRGDAERHAASTQAVREMTSAAEAALARAADAERDAAAEVVSLRKEASALAARVEAARVEEERRRERRDVDALVADVDAAEKEVLRKAERNAETMETLRASVDALAAKLAGEGGGGFAIVEKTEESLERSSFPAAEMFANRATAAGVDASRIPEVSFRPLCLSAGTTSRRHEPWFPEVATRVKNGVSGFEPATAGVRSPKRSSAVAEAAMEAREAADRARARRDGREREAAVSAAGRDGTGFVSAAEDAASTFASRREGASASERFLKEGEKEKARAEARKARASLETARAEAHSRPGDWQVRLEELEASNERTRARVEAAKTRREAAEREREESRAPKPRRSTPPKPWK